MTMVEARDLLQCMQSWQESGSSSSSRWGARGSPGNFTTIKILKEKAKFYTWLVKFVASQISQEVMHISYSQQMEMRLVENSFIAALQTGASGSSFIFGNRKIVHIDQLVYQSL